MRAWLIALVAACGGESAPAADASVAIEVDGEIASVCEPGMALVETGTVRVCIDRHEGALEEQEPDGTWQDASPYLTVGTRTVRAVPAAGQVPQGYISGKQAQAACALAGKRLCTSAEWLAACRGADDHAFPYGASYVAGACNDAYAGHPVVDYFGTSTGIWDPAHMNDPGINQQPGTVSRGGERTACTTAAGVFDLHGNLHEWVADAAGTFRGGFYADARRNGAGCAYATTAHDFAYHDYSTGFRCCADVR
ncbi:MAG: SUMF1/EgtB/PvdO family nonheme iron enzyme [Deltaproteobacteria bacterium]|nr:SUMF1/EgtB/PvdO family nonheme iron enzyme [Deltaproteobacteria bacterium]MDQ3294995.1 SUMF1/EgtB/PvdO family nonheme iron enzyme [Myxococcota bacterium]